MSKAILIAARLTALTVPAAEAQINRSTAAKNAFKATHPCSANGNRSGSCPGYIIDHIKAPACPIASYSDGNTLTSSR